MVSKDRGPSSTSITGVAPIAISSNSTDRAFLDPSKYRIVEGVRVDSFLSGSYISGGWQPVTYNQPGGLGIVTDAPDLKDIQVIDAVTYLDSNGKTRAKLTFKILNPDDKKIIDVDIFRSIPGGNS